ncbi:MAG: AMP-binding protein, partial [Gammaproteobacteria bacterium]|nr:AMP-binding protein [Gammaproteobacteria bacterium]
MLSNPVDGARVPGQVGVPLPGVEMRIVNEDTGKPCERGEVGELQTRGPHVFSGYWNDPDKTSRSFTSDGWFRTGDLGLRDSHGRFELKGRMTDLIITGGFNVYPTEVEHVLARHPGVSQCAVAGVPDADWGEAVTAFVVRANTSMTAEELVRHSRSALTAYKSPKRVVFVDALPRNAMGKVQKKTLVSGLAAESPKSA